MITMEAEHLAVVLEKALNAPKPLPLPIDVLTFSTLLKDKLSQL